MLINTKFLGEVEIDEKEILTFQNGLPGFHEYKKFALIGLDPDLPVSLLQSIDEIEVSFVIAYPFAFKKDYAFDLDDADREELAIENESEVVTYSIVTLKDSFADSTLNLLAPIIVNSSNRLAKQIVLTDNNQFPLQYKIGTFIGSEA